MFTRSQFVSGDIFAVALWLLARFPAKLNRRVVVLYSDRGEREGFRRDSTLLTFPVSDLNSQVADDQ